MVSAVGAFASTRAECQNLSRATASQPGRATATWTLVEDLRIAGENGPKSFTEIAAVVATSSGNIFVLETRAKEIRVFDAGGRFLRLAARSGAGPGEIAEARGLAVGRDDIVWASDVPNGRLSLYRANGEFFGQIKIKPDGYEYPWLGVIDDSGRALERVVVPSTRIDPKTNELLPAEPRVRRIRRDTSRVDTLPHPVCPGLPRDDGYVMFGRGRGSMMVSIPHVSRQQTLITSKGGIWCTPSNEYTLFHGPVGGSALSEVVRRSDPAPAVTAVDRARWNRTVDSLTTAIGAVTYGDPRAIPRAKPAIAAIFGDDEGRVWVRRTVTSTDRPEFDVFDPTGRHVAVARSPGEVGNRSHVRGNHLYTVIKDADDVPIVVRYRIGR